MKKCLFCNNEFEVKSRNQGFCSEECKKKGNKIKHLKYIKENSVKIKKQAKKHRSEPEIKKKAKDYYINNKENIELYRRNYRIENIDKICNGRKDWANRNKEKLFIYRKENNKRMRLLRKTNEYLKKQYLAEAKANRYFSFHKKKLNLNLKCSICGIEENIQKHHPDYSKPLEIVMLCRRCHSRLHNKIINPEKLEIIDLKLRKLVSENGRR